jgi:hypothetical protein
VPVAADYVGDGSTDLAVAKRSTPGSNGAMNWSVRESSFRCNYLRIDPSQCSIVSTTLGKVTDVPLALPYFYEPRYRNEWVGYQ